MVSGQHMRHEKRKGMSGGARAAASAVLLLVIVGVVVLATSPSGCQSNGSIATTSDEEVQRELTARATDGTVIEKVTIDGRTFNLELVADAPSRLRGLGGRTEIAADGGMLFVFPESRGLAFVMRDCLVAIDVIFLDSEGVITAMHTMPPEDPKRDDETDFMYENRLKRYSSRFSAQFAIELAGGTKDGLNIKIGDRIALDVARLKRLAK